MGQHRISPPNFFIWPGIPRRIWLLVLLPTAFICIMHKRACPGTHFLRISFPFSFLYTTRFLRGAPSPRCFLSSFFSSLIETSLSLKLFGVWHLLGVRKVLGVWNLLGVGSFLDMDWILLRFIWLREPDISSKQGLISVSHSARAPESQALIGFLEAVWVEIEVDTSVVMVCNPVCKYLVLVINIGWNSRGWYPCLG